MIGLATVILATPKLPQILSMLSRLKPLLALHIYAACSIIWSANPASTFRNSAYLALYLIAAAYLAIRSESEELLNWIASAIVILGLLSIPGQFLLPRDPSEQDYWRGVFLQKNELGAAMAIGIAAIIANGNQRKLMRAVFLSFCSILLFLSGSVTAIICAIAVVVIHLYGRLNHRLRPVLVSLVVGVSAFLAIALPNLSEVFSRTTGKDMTFSGRTEVWAIVINKIMTHPFFGYGYTGFWTTEAEAVHQQLINWSPHHAHNGYLNISLDLGFAGLSLILLALLDGLRRSRNLHALGGDTAGHWLFLVTVALSLHNLSEVDFLQTRIMWFVFLLVYLSAWKSEYDLVAEWVAGVEGVEPEVVSSGALIARRSVSRSFSLFTWIR